MSLNFNFLKNGVQSLLTLPFGKPVQSLETLHSEVRLEVKMSTQTQSPAKTDFSIHPATLLGHVSLTVANLENQITFYQQVLGFKLHWREGNKAGLGAGGAEVEWNICLQDHREEFPQRRKILPFYGFGNALLCQERAVEGEEKRHVGPVADQGNRERDGGVRTILVVR